MQKSGFLMTRLNCKYVVSSFSHDAFSDVLERITACITIKIVDIAIGVQVHQTASYISPYNHRIISSKFIHLILHENIEERQT